MGKYIISVICRKNTNDITQGGAAVKAPKDVENIAINVGFKRAEVYMYSSYNMLHRYFSLIIQLISLSFKLEKKSIVLFQYPLINPRIFSIVLLFYRKFHLIALIHDINSIRLDGHLSFLEKINLSYFNDLIVHSNQMELFLQKKFPNKAYHILEYFPYLASLEEYRRQFSLNVCFAGNIYKSPSVIDYFEIIKDVNLFLYIKKRDYLVFNKNTIYKGLFDPDYVQGIEGSWGLIWDGDSMEDCVGNQGLYTKMNAPHKLSLYSVARLPIIVWKGAAIASIVEREKIGITVSSLVEIEEIIKNTTQKQYDEYVDNIIRFSENVISGNNLISLLNIIK